MWPSHQSSVLIATAHVAVQAPSDEPVWRQVLRLHLDHSDPAIVHQAVAALGE
jgi:hypothetical protein